MTTPFKVANKIDDFALEISIADISLLTHGLLQLQHARYPHLVPMYRTVHRTKPRAMVLRAIRWVNPKRMFPGAGLTKEEMMNMSEEELRKLAVKRGIPTFVWGGDDEKSINKLKMDNVEGIMSDRPDLL